MIIGQTKLLQDIDTTLKNGFSVFSIIVGPEGGGKKTIAKMIAAQLYCLQVSAGITVSDVRTVIDSSYKVRERTVYIFPNADKMSQEAKSALLKITEEPPNNSYFIMTVESLASMPATIVSRATVFHLNPYTVQELEEYSREQGVPVVACEFCDTPGDLNIYKTQDVNQFLDYVRLVVDNIADVSLCNSLKIGVRVALKETDTGYDMRLFWKAFVRECHMRVKNGSRECSKYARGILITSHYIQELSTRGINKNMLFLDWILQIRKEWS